MMASSKRKTDRQVWDELTADAELERIKHLSRAELDAEIRAAGGDPDAIGRRGAALASKLLPERGLDWKARAKARAAETIKRVGEWPSFAGLTRTELLARLQAARTDARFSAPVVAAFRKRTSDESSDDELRAILEEVEVLRRLKAPEGE
jgi:hypothetical protein